MSWRENARCRRNGPHTSENGRDAREAGRNRERRDGLSGACRSKCRRRGHLPVLSLKVDGRTLSRVGRRGPGQDMAEGLVALCFWQRRSKSRHEMSRISRRLRQVVRSTAVARGVSGPSARLPVSSADDARQDKLCVAARLMVRARRRFEKGGKPREGAGRWSRLDRAEVHLAPSMTLWKRVTMRAGGKRHSPIQALAARSPSSSRPVTVSKPQRTSAPSSRFVPTCSPSRRLLFVIRVPRSAVNQPSWPSGFRSRSIHSRPV